MTASLHIEAPSIAPSSQAMDQALNFLSTLFMALRTAQIHEPNNRAYQQAVDTVYRASNTLFELTGEFSIQFMEDSAYFNGTRLRFASGTFAALRTLRQLFENRGIGGISIRRSPRREAVQRLITLVARPRSPSVANLPEAGFELLGLSQLKDQTPIVHIDRRVFAVQCYAKLILASREPPISADTHPTSAQLRAVRVIQHLIDLCDDRADILLRLTTNRHGGNRGELASANACVLAIAVGYIVGFDRRNLVDLGVAALSYRSDHAASDPNVTAETISRILRSPSINRSTYLRIAMISECSSRGSRTTQTNHPYARLLSAIIAYGQLTSRGGWHPLDALARLYNQPHHYDRRYVDLLINVMRAFPVGVRVVLSDGTLAKVHSHDGSSRWDRPVVQVLKPTGAAEPTPYNLDLMVRRDARFEHRIVGTQYFVHAAGAKDPLQNSNLPEVRGSPNEIAAATVSAAPIVLPPAVNPSVLVHDLQL